MHKSTVFFTGLLQVCIRPRVREFQEFESAQLSLNPYGEEENHCCGIYVAKVPAKCAGAFPKSASLPRRAKAKNHFP